MGTNIRVGVSLRAYRSALLNLADSPPGSAGETSTTTPTGTEPCEIILAVHVEEMTHGLHVVGKARALLRPLSEAANILSRIAAALAAWFVG